LAPKGRLLVIGTVASYTSEKGIQGDKVDTLQLLASSRTVSGFFMPAHMKEMVRALREGKLVVKVDDAGLYGLDQIASGVEYMHQGKNMGKVVIPLLKPRSKL
jgi:NADPH-dependent curcumin reductase CurA